MSFSGDIIQEFGEGSEYGKAAREELRRKKYGRQTRKYDHDNQPWQLTIEQNVSGVGKSENANVTSATAGKSMTTSKKIRKFRSIREAGATEHADWWVFYKVCKVFINVMVKKIIHFLALLIQKFFFQNFK